MPERDWGHARDYVEGMWRMLQQDEPDDYVLATGEAHSVRQFVELAFAHGGREIVMAWPWHRRGGHRSAHRRGADRDRSALFRPTEVERLVGDPSKARERLGWHHTLGLKSWCARWSTAISPCSKPAASRTCRPIEGLAWVSTCAASASTSPAIAAWSARHWYAASRRRNAGS